MKKLVSGVLVLLTLAAAAFFIMKVRSRGPVRLRAMELAPAETILFAHVPNLRATAVRFQKTGLFAIWQEPEMQEFVAKPRRTAPPMRLWEDRLARLGRVAPGEVFVAVTSMNGPQPQFVAGFSFAGKRREVEALMAGPREELKQRWPAGKSEFTSHKGAAIETFTHAQGMLAECYVRDWYFVASDTTLLRATLDRFEKQSPTTAGALAGDEVFQKAIAPLGGEPDVMLFAQTAALGERVGALMPAAGKARDGKESANAKEARAIAVSTRIEGAQMRDTVFILSPQEAAETPLTRNTLAMNRPETFLYFTTRIASLEQLPESITAVVAALPGIAAMDSALAGRNLGWSGFGNAFGPEMGMTLAWPDAATMPAMLLAVEVRDAEKAREFVGAATSGGAGVPAWNHRESAGVAHYSAPAEAPSLTNPAIAITPRFALFGFDADAMATMDVAGAEIAPSSPFRDAVRQLAAPTSGFGYLDAAAFFERAYRALRPALAMSLAFSENLGDYIDAGKLPSAQTISRHLVPSVYSQSANPSGILIESTGTLTFNQVVIGAIAVAAAAMPDRDPQDEPEKLVDSAPVLPSAKPSFQQAIAEPIIALPSGSESDRGAAPAQARPEAGQ